MPSRKVNPLGVALPEGGSGEDAEGKTPRGSRGEDAVSEAAAGPLSRLTFSWMTPLFELGNIRPLETADLPEPSPADDATACTEKLERMWEKRAKRVAKLRAKPPKKRSPGLQFGLSWRFLGWRFVLAGVLLLAELSIDLLPAILLNWLVSALELPPGEGETTTAQLWLLCGALLVLPMARTVLDTFRSALLLRAGLQLRNAYCGKIYRKVLRLTNAARQEASSGHIINVMSTDSGVPAQYLGVWHYLWLPWVAMVILGPLLMDPNSPYSPGPGPVIEGWICKGDPFVVFAPRSQAP